MPPKNDRGGRGGRGRGSSQVTAHVTASEIHQKQDAKAQVSE
jgi:hypothetical protein